MSAAPHAARPPVGISAGLLETLYRTLWYPALPFALLAAGGSRGPDRRERLGRPPIAITGAARRVWMHAASVGEIEAIRPLARGMRERFPEFELVVTAMTAAGRDAARRRIPGAAACLLAPLDCPAALRGFLARVRPEIVLLAETELWPNLIGEASRAGARVGIVNGRLSERSLRRYKLVYGLIAAALGRLEIALVQSREDADRFVALGAPAGIVAITGNTKFDPGDTPAPPRLALRNFAGGRPLLIAGSTAPGEERMSLTAYGNLRDRFPGLALALAPRHLERAGEVAAEIQAAGFRYVRASELPPADYDPSALDLKFRDASVLLLDTMGELRALYGCAAIAFVGGSIAPPRGGQNLAEPAAAGVPVIFGPHYENQRQVGDALLNVGGARVIEGAAEMEIVCGEWLADGAARHAAGARARSAFTSLAGGAVATLDHLTSFFRNI